VKELNKVFEARVLSNTWFSDPGTSVIEGSLTHSLELAIINHIVADWSNTYLNYCFSMSLTVWENYYWSSNFKQVLI
jgi:hypothetical protein